MIITVLLVIAALWLVPFWVGVLLLGYLFPVTLFVTVPAWVIYHWAGLDRFPGL